MPPSCPDTPKTAPAPSSLMSNPALTPQSEKLQIITREAATTTTHVERGTQTSPSPFPDAAVPYPSPYFLPRHSQPLPYYLPPPVFSCAFHGPSLPNPLLPRQIDIHAGIYSHPHYPGYYPPPYWFSYAYSVPAIPGPQPATQPPSDQPSPLIAPRPKLAFASPDSISIGSSTSSPSSGPTALPTVKHETPMPQAISTATPEDDLQEPYFEENHMSPVYKSLRTLLIHSEANIGFLEREAKGEEVCSTHGVGLWSYRGDVAPGIEDAKRDIWRQRSSYDDWIKAARARTASYAVPGAIKPPLRWVLVEPESSNEEDAEDKGLSIVGKGQRFRRKRSRPNRIKFPVDALQTGTEVNGRKLFSARAWWENGLHLGKAGSHLNDGASISYGSLERPMSTFEVLVGDSECAKWIDIPKGTSLVFSPSSSFVPALPADFVPVEGGREACGKPMFVAQAAYEQGWHPGKGCLEEDHCCASFGGGEVWIKGFRVLGYSI